MKTIHRFSERHAGEYKMTKKRSMKIKWPIQIFLGVIIVYGCTAVLAQEKKTEEELLFMDIPNVITAARVEQPITEAPATVEIITAEDIRHSGLENIPDILRTVAGVDVITLSRRDQQVSIRGLNGAQSNHALVMIDGRSIYWDIYGFVFWDIQSIGLEEIERIEIVKTPGSSLYGANAYAGIVNIITKTPEQMKGTRVRLHGGINDMYGGTVLHAGTHEKVNYKVSAEWNTVNEWNDHRDEGAMEVRRGDARFDYTLDETRTVSLSAGRGRMMDRKMFASNKLGTLQLNGNVDHLRVDFTDPQVIFRGFLRKEDVDVEELRSGNRQPFVTTTADIEYQHSLEFHRKHTLLWGGNLRHLNLDENDFFPDSHKQTLWAIFLESQINLTDHLVFTMGGRFDGHPLVDNRISPRGNILFSPYENHTFRMSAAQAYRNPTLTESYLFVDHQLQSTLPQPFPPQDVPTTFITQGNLRLKPESITSTEFGYQFSISPHLWMSMNVFYNLYNDFIRTEKTITFYDADEIFPGSPSGLIPKRIVSTFDNWGKARGFGGEFDIRLRITNWLTCQANYAYLEIRDSEDLVSTTLIDETDRIRTEYPRNKVNVGLRLRPYRGWAVNLLGHWVDSTLFHTTDIEENEYLTTVDDYMLFNVRLGYTFYGEKADISLAVFNLLNDIHYEYPPGINLPDESSREIGRQITLQLEFNF